MAGSPVCKALGERGVSDVCLNSRYFCVPACYRGNPYHRIDAVLRLAVLSRHNPLSGFADGAPRHGITPIQVTISRFCEDFERVVAKLIKTQEQAVTMGKKSAAQILRDVKYTLYKII